MRFVNFLIIFLLLFSSCQKFQNINYSETEVCEFYEEILPEIDPLRIRAEEITASLEDSHLVAQVFL